MLSRPSKGWHGSQVQRRVEVDPVGVELLAQGDLPIAVPVLQLLFAADRLADVVVGLVPDEAVDIVLCREPWDDPVFVLEDAPTEVVRDTNIERAVLAARQDVDPVGSRHAAFAASCSLRRLK